MTLEPEALISGFGEKEKLYTEPIPETPLGAVPYRMLPESARSPLPPSLPPLKVCKTVKPVPSVFLANSVPLMLPPPPLVVP